MRKNGMDMHTFSRTNILSFTKAFEQRVIKLSLDFYGSFFFFAKDFFPTLFPSYSSINSGSSEATEKWKVKTQKWGVKNQIPAEYCLSLTNFALLSAKFGEQLTQTAPLLAKALIKDPNLLEYLRHV